MCLTVQLSVHGGSAWSYDHVREQYYYHYYNQHMPDFNYRNRRVLDELLVSGLDLPRVMSSCKTAVQFAVVYGRAVDVFIRGSHGVPTGSVQILA